MESDRQGACLSVVPDVHLYCDLYSTYYRTSFTFGKILLDRIVWWSVKFEEKRRTDCSIPFYTFHSALKMIW